RKQQIRLSPALAYILQEVRREASLRQADGVDEEEVQRPEEAVARVAERLGFELTPYERDEVLAHMEREEEIFGILQPLVDDPQVSDIIVTNYANVSFQQGRRNYRTDLSFVSERSYEAFVERLLQRAGTSYSTKKPIADGMIGSFARIHVVHRSLCESGPYLTIRLNRFGTVEAKQLIDQGLAPKPVLDYLSAAVRSGLTLLIVGEVGTGKTTLARAI